jgi:hypothetical protein
MGGYNQETPGCFFLNIVNRLLTGGIIQSGEGFIHQDSAGGCKQAADNGNPAFHAAAESGDRTGEGF